MKSRILILSSLLLIPTAVVSTHGQVPSPASAPKMEETRGPKIEENGAPASISPSNSASEAVEKKSQGGENWMFFSRTNKTLEGTPVDMKVVEITILGERISVPLSAIRGIRFGEGLYDVCTVKLMNGDTLNGSIERQIFRIGMDWGEIQVDRQKVGYFVRSAFVRAPIPAYPNDAQPSEPPPASATASPTSSEGEFSHEVVPVSAEEPSTEGNYELATPEEALDGDDFWLWGNPQKPD
jgi:hypothetical protein